MCDKLNSHFISKISSCFISFAVKSKIEFNLFQIVKLSKKATMFLVTDNFPSSDEFETNSDMTRHFFVA